MVVCDIDALILLSDGDRSVNKGVASIVWWCLVVGIAWYIFKSLRGDIEGNEKPRWERTNQGFGLLYYDLSLGEFSH